MKSLVVRISENQANKLNDVASQFPGITVSALVHKSIDLWLEIEGPVYEAALKEARSKIERQKIRQPVAS